jgi:diguanylate cyclase (GGDEF)-like protein
LRAHDIIGRYGGEEFVLLLPETDLKGARELAEYLRSAVASTPVKTHQGEITRTASFGVMSLDDDINDLTDMLNKADIALYQAKEKGRNCVVDYAKSSGK